MRSNETTGNIEVISPPDRKAEFSFALFDFDGTISLIREGWREIMVPYFTEELQKTPAAATYDADFAAAGDFVDRLTGKQTIFQCQRLADEVALRGGKPLSAGEYKAEYLRRLSLHTAGRMQDLRGGCDREKYMVGGAVSLLSKLSGRGVSLCLASGTDEPNVIEEARLLGVDSFFDGGIFGAHDDMADCSKEAVIRRIMTKQGLSGSQLLAFGDGFVEIELVAAAGGYAVGVATDEACRGRVDQFKRRRLKEAGAGLIIPDFSAAAELVEYLFPAR